jgi:hypothetical protein
LGFVMNSKKKKKQDACSYALVNKETRSKHYPIPMTTDLVD